MTQRLERLALLTLALALGAGCVITDFSDLQEALPVKEGNYAPSINPLAITPSTSQCFILSRDTSGSSDGSCTSLFKIATIKDMDFDDVLFARWFMDVDDKDPSTGFLFQEKLPRRGPEGRGPVRYILDGAALSVGPHVLSLFVSDGFDPDTTTELLDVAGGKDVLHVSWCVDVASDCGGAT